MGSTIQIAVVEDEPGYRKQLDACLREFARLQNCELTINFFNSGESFLKAMESMRYPVVFLDIYMGGMSGIETAGIVREKDRNCVIVFCTTDKDQMSKAFSLHAFDYIIKPVTQEQITRVMTDAMKMLPDVQKYITLKSEGQNISVLNSDIMTAVTDGHYITVQTKQGKRVTSRLKMSGLLELLDNDERFLIVNRGILVNMDEVASMQKGQCIMSDGTKCPIKSTDSNAIIQSWHDYCFKKLRAQQEFTARK